jgi:Cof subfamily protein (haloacid dehalogenase superfamily)
MIRLVAIDIDGTLLDSSGGLPDANRRAISEAIGMGVEVALATGRRYDFARGIFEQLPAPLTLILNNGAVVKTRDGETLQRRLLPREVAHDVLQRTPEYRESAAVVFDRPRDGQVVYEAIDWDHPRRGGFYRTNCPFLAESKPLESCLSEDPVQVMFTGGCSPMRELQSLLGRSGDDRFAVTLTEYQHRDFSLVDVISAGVCKGTALEAWAQARGYGRDEVMAIGDNFNDAEMLEYAGTPVVMGNCIAELRSRGWFETASNDNEGVARALETLVLNQERGHSTLR